ncbi:MAG TPA: hypothetical protein VHP35_16555, partial [Terriglobia bacterium]|nr:hypothetical protein [Terriglobia bacterium]
MTEQVLQKRHRCLALTIDKKALRGTPPPDVGASQMADQFLVGGLAESQIRDWRQLRALRNNAIDPSSIRS